jgi:hypothetical protein
MRNDGFPLADPTVAFEMFEANRAEPNNRSCTMSLDLLTGELRQGETEAPWFHVAVRRGGRDRLA